MGLKQIFLNIEKTEQLPVIFAGSGVTKRYTNNKYNWKELLVKCISMYSKDPESKYKEYETVVTYRINSQQPEDKSSLNEAIGSEVERDFNIAYYKQQIAELNVPPNQNPLKYFISTLLSSYSLDENYSQETELFKKLQNKMLTVVTTNYDTFFEDHIFTQHEKLIGQNVFSNSEVGTLFKIHGCTAEPNSIVITENDYTVFKKKRKILAAKLISLFTENPVIFMGYSLQDENIKNILSDIFMCLDDDPNLLSELEKRLIVVNFNTEVPNVIVGNHSLVIGDGTLINLTKITTASYQPILEEMQNLTRKIRFKEIKLIEDLVYDVVHSKEGESRRVVNMLDDTTDDDEVILMITKQEHALAEFGITGLTKEQLFNDLINNDVFSIDREEQAMVIRLLLEVQLKNLLQGNFSLPVHKYLYMYRGETQLALDSRVKTLIDKDIRDYYNRDIRKSIPEYKKYNFTFLESILEEDISISKKLNFLVLHAVKKAPVDEIREFLEVHKEYIINLSTGPTYFRKLACIYDIKKYKAPNEDSVS